MTVELEGSEGEQESDDEIHEVTTLVNTEYIVPEGENLERAVSAVGFAPLNGPGSHSNGSANFSFSSPSNIDTHTPTQSIPLQPVEEEKYQEPANSPGEVGVNRRSDSNEEIIQNNQNIPVPIFDPAQVRSHIRPTITSEHQEVDSATYHSYLENPQLWLKSLKNGNFQPLKVSEERKRGSDSDVSISSEQL